MMTHMLKTEQAKQPRRVLFKQEHYAQRKVWLKDKEFSQNAELLTKESDEPTPSREISKCLHALDRLPNKTRVAKLPGKPSRVRG